MNTTINQQKNVTVAMIFMNGTHTIIINDQIDIAAPKIVTMTGESQNITVICGTCTNHQSINFQNNITVITNLKMIGWFILIRVSSSKMKDCTFQESKVQIIRAGNVILKDCTLQDSHVEIYIAMNVTLKDCHLYRSPAIINNVTTAIFAGDSDLAASRQAITSYYSDIILSGKVSFVNNTGTNGGAMTLYSSTLGIVPGTNVSFINNSVTDKGGAIYVEPGLSATYSYRYSTCFYLLMNCSDNTTYNLYFANNSAMNGGNDIYGATLTEGHCVHKTTCNLTVTVASPSNSSNSSDPLRVCICDDGGKPQCTNNSYIINNLQVYPGEKFTVSAVVVGGDLGLTTGAVYAEFSPKNSVSIMQPTSQNSQVINSITSCGQLNYTLYPQDGVPYITMYLTTGYRDTTTLHPTPCFKDDSYCFSTAPVSFNITILSCPFGFLKESLECICHPSLTQHDVDCHSTTHGIETFSWNDELWINITKDETIYISHCPFDYCNLTGKWIDLQNDPDSQCAFNRAGRLCGGCKENYSLAVGSTHCIQCSNNNNMALFIFFAAAGLLLVFFISALNLTVTQGAINGLIFYANIVWTYQSIFFPQEQGRNVVLIFLKIFIAWINLDFGIETCFINGLNAFWKTWLQFIFPLYIWAIAGLVIVATRHSSRLTNLLGNRAVPVLATLLLLSYMKLLRTIGTTLQFSILTKYPSKSTIAVWSVDGSLSYFGILHSLLFLAGLVILLSLWFPYTLVLFLIQWLRRLSHFRLLKWIMRFHPVYDAYFAPLKHKHQYWFGVLLLARGILLVTFASAFAIPQSINNFLLNFFGVVLLLYMTLVQPYKSVAILTLQSSFLANLTLLSGFISLTYNIDMSADARPTLQAIAVGLSTGVAFLQFCGIVLYAIIAPRCCYQSRLNRNNKRKQAVTEEDDDYLIGYHDSIHDESQPLLPTY